MNHWYDTNLNIMAVLVENLNLSSCVFDAPIYISHLYRKWGFFFFFFFFMVDEFRLRYVRPTLYVAQGAGDSPDRYRQ